MQGLHFCKKTTIPVCSDSHHRPLTQGGWSLCLFGSPAIPLDLYCVSIGPRYPPPRVSLYKPPGLIVLHPSLYCPFSSLSQAVIIMRGLVLLLSAAVALCGAAPALEPVTCSVDGLETTAVRFAIQHINQQQDHGYKFKLSEVIVVSPTQVGPPPAPLNMFGQTVDIYTSEAEWEV